MPQHQDQAAITAAAVEEALMAQRVEILETQLKELREDRDKFLKWGIIVLGGAVVGLVTWIFNLITKH
jgi:hypothetical protein